MPASNDLALFLAAAVLLAITPGPGIFYVAARALAGGRSEGVASSLGTGLGGMLHVAAGALGVSAVVLASAALFTAMKGLGAAYLIWLGLRTLLTARHAAPPVLEAPPLGARRAPPGRRAGRGAEPKTAAFFLAFIPQFVDASGSVALAVRAARHRVGPAQHRRGRRRGMRRRPHPHPPVQPPHPDPPPAPGAPAPRWWPSGWACC